MEPLPADARVLALDQGGHSSRALLFDARGRRLAAARRAVGEARPAPERVEQDPEELVATLRDAAAEVCAGMRVAACGLATQRSSVVCWERSSGRALSPVLSWQDRRAVAELDALALDPAALARTTGLRPSPHYGASKLAWCLRELPEVRAAAARGDLLAGPLASFLAFRLLAQRPAVVDPANASRTLLVDVERGDWDPALLARFGIPRAVLPDCGPSRAAFGTLAEARAPLVVLSGDQGAALFAAGEPDPAAAYVNLGTGAFVQRPVRGEPPRLAGLLASVVHVEPGWRLGVVEGPWNGAGSALDWLARRDGPVDAERELGPWLAASERGELEPPLFLNTVSGLASPFWVTGLEPRFVGAASPGERGRAERAVAVVESVLFGVRAILDALRPALGPPARLVVTGGLSRAPAVARGLAELARAPADLSADPEATVRGLAFLVAGRPRAWEAPPASRVEPRPEGALSRRYAAWRAELERRLARLAGPAPG